MRVWLSIFLIFIISWQLLLKGGVFVWYGANYGYIVSELCENRDKPELHCNGKCILMQRIKAAEQERKDAAQRPVRIVEKLKLSQFIFPKVQKIIITFISNTIEPFGLLFSVVLNHHVSKLLKPPRILGE